MHPIESVPARHTKKPCVRCRAVHPRLRGELLKDTILFSGMDGSSPLTRGTHHIFNFPIGYGRFIPAYAGNSGLLQGCPGKHAVHPRLRGELDLRFLVIMIVYGSSPLTRGTLANEHTDDVQRRFIPAYAGNSAFFYLR